MARRVVSAFSFAFAMPRALTSWITLSTGKVESIELRDWIYMTQLLPESLASGFLCSMASALAIRVYLRISQDVLGIWSICAQSFEWVQVTLNVTRILGHEVKSWCRTWTGPWDDWVGSS